ncbi:MAG: hypothetical protein GY770_00400 [Aestuariibacter sp.]|nr:hypothetical protein [Aestuariibacter sp.]
MKRAIVTILVLATIAIGGLYYYFSQALASHDIPAMVLSAENALASPETIAIASIDMGYVLRIDNVVNGVGSPSLLLEPEAGEGIIGQLIKQGINPIKQTSYALAALDVSQKKPNYSFVLLGDYSIDPIKSALRNSYIVNEDNTDFWTFQNDPQHVEEKSDPCKVIKKKKARLPVVTAIHIQKDRILISSPQFMPTLLKRFTENAPQGTNLHKWREFRKDKVVAASVMAPKEAKKGVTDFRSAILLGGVSENPLEALYAGAQVNLLPPQGLKLTIDAHSENSVWPSEKKVWFDKWISEVKKDLEEMPSLATLLNSLSATVENNVLHMSANADQTTVNNIQKVPAEFMQMLFSSAAVKDSSPVNSEGEKIIEVKDVKKFKSSFSLSSIPLYDEESMFHKAEVITGPFGVRINEIGLFPVDDSIIQISIRAEGKGFDNIIKRTIYSDKSYSPAALKILSVEDAQGNDLLREEKCNKEPNLTSENLNIFPDKEYKNGQWITKSQKVEGAKKIRLRKKVTLDQVNSIKGEVSVKVAAQTKSETINAPFNGQIIKADKVQLTLKSGKGSRVTYKIDGDVNHILSIYAKNAKGQYLAKSASSWNSKSASMTIPQDYKGEVASVEVEYATRVESKIYPFELKDFSQKYGDKSTNEQPSVKAITKDAFLQKYSAPNYEKDCNDKRKVQAGVFMICMDKFEERWGQEIGGDFTVYAPAASGLEKNLSAIELSVDSVIDKDGKEIALNISEITDFSYSNSKTDYNRETKEWIKSNERLYGSVSLYSRDDSHRRVKASIVKGTLRIQLPKKLYSLTLSARRLGKKVKNKSGLIANISKFEDWHTYIDLQGPVDKIVQLRAIASDGTVLHTGNARINEKQIQTWNMSDEEKAIVEAKPEMWEGMITIYGKPETIDILYTDEFDILEYPFEIDLTKALPETSAKPKSTNTKMANRNTSSNEKSDVKKPKLVAEPKKITGANILLNGDFENKLKHWKVKFPIALVEGRGVDGSNALFMNALYIAPSKYIYELSASECVKIGDAVRFSVEAMFKYDSLPKKSSGHRLNLYWYEDENCSYRGQFASFLEPKLKPGWQKVRRDSVQSSLNARSVQIQATQNQRSSAKETTSPDETPVLASAYWDNIAIIPTHLINTVEPYPNAVSPHTLPIGENYVKNGSFDEGKENWKAYGDTWSKDEGYNHPGAIRTSLESTSSSIGAGAFSQCVNFGSNKHFEMGAYFKHGEESTQKGGGRFRAYWYEGEDCTGRGVSARLHDDTKQIDGWQELKVVGLEPAKGSNSVSINVVKSIKGTGKHSAYWDDFYFKAVSK